ncbi:DUF3253 domain-containing protein [Erythrobacter arachoides]|uniref:DUF3253 domain-containing protein n=1 Tax=Aurantiacibacter arachoides TaxID=1850444 RepID=A0A845A8T7_9SPHN|nr:DUF3253 domain-containing protein [Aurantiacibacter arachoides]MXO93979.1 DUF3253 domain-containing protein [Aurantiacibacter arachoides]GGD45060.1 hypothetical protein GCM10011411_00880 [Aurantiacibacter arachoides]
MTAFEAIAALLDSRAADATICPSEAARLLAGADRDWRSRMDEIHAASADLADKGAIALSWKGVPMRAPDGPYRIGRQP